MYQAPAHLACPSPAKARVCKGARRHPLDASMTLQLLAKRKGRNQKIPQLCSWKESSLALTVLPASTSVGYSHFWSFFALKAPGVSGETRLAEFGIRKESTTQSNADPQERPSLNSEVPPSLKTSLKNINQYFQLLWGVWFVALRTYKMLLDTARDRGCSANSCPDRGPGTAAEDW